MAVTMNVMKTAAVKAKPLSQPASTATTIPLTVAIKKQTATQAMRQPCQKS